MSDRRDLEGVAQRLDGYVSSHDKPSQAIKVPAHVLRECRDEIRWQSNTMTQDEVLRAWVWGRIKDLRSARECERTRLVTVGDDDEEYENRVSRMVNAGCKARAYKEVLNYLDTHEPK